jgi:DNA-directed RNA polymerase alpha subunit
LPGAAVVAVKIKGVDHEFSSVPNVKEDVIEIILNLKQLRMKVHTDQRSLWNSKSKAKKLSPALISRKTLMSKS